MPGMNGGSRSATVSWAAPVPETPETNEWRRSPRRVHVHFGGVRVADSDQAMLLRQRGFRDVHQGDRA